MTPQEEQESKWLTRVARSDNAGKNTQIHGWQCIRLFLKVTQTPNAMLDIPFW
jgi:hypothetical protein